MRIKGADLEDEFLLQILAAADSHVFFGTQGYIATCCNMMDDVGSNLKAVKFFVQHFAICGLSLHLRTTESRKNLEQKFIFQIGTLNPHGINERFSFN